VKVLVTGCLSLLDDFIDRKKFAAFMAVSFITFFHILLGSALCHCIYGCTFCLFLLNFVNYIFVLLCIIVMFKYSYCYICSVLSILFHCVLLCIVLVYMCTVLYCTATIGCQPNLS